MSQLTENMNDKNQMKRAYKLHDQEPVTVEEYYKLKNTKFAVVSHKGGVQCRSSWFYSIERARQALKIIRAKGYKAIIYVD